jgi:hypothetical protein
VQDRPSTKVHAAPGGGSSLGYLFGGGGGGKWCTWSLRMHRPHSMSGCYSLLWKLLSLSKKNNCTLSLCSVMYCLDGIHVVGHAWSWISYKMFVLVQLLIFLSFSFFFFLFCATVQIFSLFIIVVNALREDDKGNNRGIWLFEKGSYSSTEPLSDTPSPKRKG